MIVTLYKKKLEVALYRCTCPHCDLAEQKLTQLQKKYPFTIKIERVTEKAETKDLAGWSTPMVYVNGKEISRFTINAAQWEKAVQEALPLFA